MGDTSLWLSRACVALSGRNTFCVRIYRSQGVALGCPLVPLQGTKRCPQTIVIQGFTTCPEQHGISPGTLVLVPSARPPIGKRSPACPLPGPAGSGLAGLTILGAAIATVPL